MLFVADSHLGRTSDSIQIDGLPSKLIDTVTRFKEAIDRAFESNQGIVVAGDLFDSSYPRPYVVSQLLEVFQYAHTRKVMMYLIPGNHDCDVRWTSLVIPEKANFPNVTVIRAPNRVETEEGVIHFLPHMPRQQLDTYSSFGGLFAEEEVGVLCGHANTSGAKTSSEIELEAGNAIEFDPGEFQYRVTVLGHLHNHQVLNESSRPIIYPGSMIPLDFGEIEDTKGWVELNLHDFAWSFYPFQSEVQKYRHIRIDLVTKSEVDFAPEKLKSLIDGHLVKVSVYARDPMQVDEQSIRKALDKHGQVMRFETIYCSDPARIDLEDDGEFKNLDYVELLRLWLQANAPGSPAKVRKEALKIGTRIIQSVLADQNA